GMPSLRSTTTTVRASSFSASRWAVVAPTFPAPTTVILLSIEFEGLKAPKAKSAAPCVHLPVRIGTQRRERIQRRPRSEAQTLFSATVRAVPPTVGDEIHQLRIACAVRSEERRVGIERGHR